MSMNFLGKSGELCTNYSQIMHRTYYYVIQGNSPHLECKMVHGIPEYRATRLKEMGTTDAHRMAILGHETYAEASRYSKSADMRKIITGTEFPNFLPTRQKN